MEVLPVLDLLDGVVVRGVAGKRSEYRPIQSRLTSSVQAIDIARVFQSVFGFRKFYVADLDAILHQRPNWDIYRQLIGSGFRLLVDAGIRNVEQSLAVRQCGAEPIVGLELCSSPSVLSEIHQANQGFITFSLDLRDGEPIIPDNSSDWKADALEIARQSVACGVRRIIVLDLADVGTSSGGRTDDLCRRILAESAGLELTCGGGVRGPEDLERLRLVGVSAVLVASALHDGRLSPNQLRSPG